MANDLIDLVAEVGGAWLYVLAAGFAFGDAALLLDFLVPGEVGMIVAAASADRADLHPLPMAAAASIGAVVGDSLSYAVGRRWGMGLLRRWDWLRRRLEPRALQAAQHFEHRGGPAVFVGRWVGALRAVVPFVAGTAGMSYRRFLAWDVVAAATWVATVLTLGWLLGPRIADVVDRYSSLLSIAVVALLVLFVVVRRRLRAGRPVAAAPSE